MSVLAEYHCATHDTTWDVWGSTEPDEFHPGFDCFLPEDPEKTKCPVCLTYGEYRGEKESLA